MNHLNLEKTIALRNSQLHLTKRDKSLNWQIHCKVNSSGQWLRKSSYTSDLDQAKAAAEDLFHEVRIMEKSGFVVGSKKFKVVANLLIAEYKRKISLGTARPIYRDYICSINKYLIPFFGEYSIGTIEQSVMSEFAQWHREKIGYEPKASTQKTHNAAFNAIHDFAIKKGMIPAHLKPKTITDGVATVSRGVFTSDELKRMNEFFPSWINQTQQEKSRKCRTLLKLLVNFVTWTGVRAGTEIDQLKWQHLDLIEQTDLNIIHITLPKGKVGSRTLIARHEIRDTLDQLRQLHPEFIDLTLDELIRKKADKYIFSFKDNSLLHAHTFVKNFNRFMKDAGICSLDTSGKKRSLYSLRHYYATQRILEGANFGQLANQMGTSVLMLERHYSHLKPIMLAQLWAGVK